MTNRKGEYIAPEKIENILSQHPRILQAFLYGNSLKASLVAIIVPDPEAFLPWARAETKKSSLTLEEACQNGDLIKIFLKELSDHGKSCGLNG